MAFQNPDSEQIRAILQKAKNIAVIGLSDTPERTSYAISHTMQQRGYRIFPVNPNIKEALGEPAVARVTAITEPIDIINIFRQSDALPEVIADCLQTDAPVIWGQQGVYHEDAANQAISAGKTVIMDRCIAVMHSRLIGSTNA